MGVPCLDEGSTPSISTLEINRPERQKASPDNQRITGLAFFSWGWVELINDSVYQKLLYLFLTHSLLSSLMDFSVPNIYTLFLMWSSRLWFFYSSRHQWAMERWGTWKLLVHTVFCNRCCKMPIRFSKSSKLNELPWIKCCCKS